MKMMWCDILCQTLAHVCQNTWCTKIICRRVLLKVNETVLRFAISLCLNQTVMRLVREKWHPLDTLDSRKAAPKWTGCFNNWHLLPIITYRTVELVINVELEDILSYVICIYPASFAPWFEPERRRLSTKPSSE
jgi:hypothetical protein